MHLDQIYLMVIDEDLLKTRRLASGTPEQLVRAGVIEDDGLSGKSLAQIIRERAERKAAGEDDESKLSKRERRKRRIARLKEYVAEQQSAEQGGPEP